MTLQRDLRELREFAAAHHGDEAPTTWLHDLTVDVVDRVEHMLGDLEDGPRDLIDRTTTRKALERLFNDEAPNADLFMVGAVLDIIDAQPEVAE